MATEDIKGDENRSLVPIPKPGGLELTSDNTFLQRTGFTTAFPARLVRLNESLANKGAPIESLGIDFTPGRDPSLSYVEEHAASGFTVSIRSHGRRKAYLLLSFTGEGSGLDLSPLGVTLSDLQGFFRMAFPDSAIDLHAFAEGRDRFVPYPHPRSEFPLDDAQLKTDFLKLEGRTVNRWVDFRRPIHDMYRYRQIAITRTSQNEPVVIADLQARVDHSGKYKKGFDAVVFHPRELLIVDTPQKVDEAMDYVAGLFDKPDMYPYRLVDRQKKK